MNKKLDRQKLHENKKNNIFAVWRNLTWSGLHRASNIEIIEQNTEIGKYVIVLNKIKKLNQMKEKK